MALKTYSTFKIAKMLDVYPTTVAKWADEGKLKAHTTPGGHRRVRVPDLLEFLKEYEMPIPDELAREGRLRVLVVDDDEMVLSALAAVLRASGEDIEVLTATDGFEAGQIVTMKVPDLVVLDIMLPGLDGFKVCSIIKEQYPSMKVLAITGYGSKDVREKMLAAGADAFLTKPVDMDEFLTHVEELSGRVLSGE
jgi:excisionase family DNA binding protein